MSPLGSNWFWVMQVGVRIHADVLGLGDSSCACAQQSIIKGLRTSLFCSAVPQVFAAVVELPCCKVSVREPYSETLGSPKSAASHFPLKHSCTAEVHVSYLSLTSCEVPVGRVQWSVQWVVGWIWGRIHIGISHIIICITNSTPFSLWTSCGYLKCASMSFTALCRFKKQMLNQLSWKWSVQNIHIC